MRFLETIAKTYKKFCPFLDGTIYGLTYGFQELFMVFIKVSKLGQPGTFRFKHKKARENNICSWFVVVISKPCECEVMNWIIYEFENPGIRNSS